jgi:hypothetical protein
MKIHLRSYFFIAFLFFVCFSSCVTKKKYATLQKNTASKETSFQSERSRYLSLNDSLRKTIMFKDSIIDSLSFKLNSELSKREKEKEKERARLAALAASKSTLTKEQEFEKKSIFIYNFTKLVEWPIEYNGIEFVIGVAGDDQKIKDLKDFMAQKKVTGKKIIVEKYRKGARYNLIYITSKEIASFSTIKSAVKKSKTLLVSDEAVEGSHISFLLDEDKVRYFVNKIAIEKLGLKVGQELLRYAG